MYARWSARGCLFLAVLVAICGIAYYSSKCEQMALDTEAARSSVPTVTEDRAVDEATVQKSALHEVAPGAKAPEHEPPALERPEGSRLLTTSHAKWPYELLTIRLKPYVSSSRDIDAMAAQLEQDTERILHDAMQFAPNEFRYWHYQPFNFHPSKVDHETPIHWYCEVKLNGRVALPTEVRKQLGETLAQIHDVWDVEMERFALRAGEKTQLLIERYALADPEDGLDFLGERSDPKKAAWFVEDWGAGGVRTCDMKYISVTLKHGLSSAQREEAEAQVDRWMADAYPEPPYRDRSGGSSGALKLIYAQTSGMAIFTERHVRKIETAVEGVEKITVGGHWE